MHILADIAGIPGKDCRGFCKYCYFKKVTELKALGCQHCPPEQIGCPKCTQGVAETVNEFKTPFTVISEVQTALMINNPRDHQLKINISGGGDVSCYPQLEELTQTFQQYNIPMHLGYTSGKGIDNPLTATNLINHGVDEVTYTLFATDPQLRKEWVRDPTPEASIQAAEIFAQSTELHVASVIVPGINDGKILEQTCNTIETWGVEALILMRFANYREQGLILGSEPLVEGIEPHTITQFEELVKQINSQYSFKVTGTPLCDPNNNAPFAISKDENQAFLQFIPPIQRSATLLTSQIAAPFLKNIIEKLNAQDKVNIVSCKKDIACLITSEDIQQLDLSEIKKSVIIPGRAYLHDKQTQELLSQDGTQRIIGRGPEKLSVDGEMSSTLTEEQIIEKEIEAFIQLVEAINFFGT